VAAGEQCVMIILLTQQQALFADHSVTGICRCALFTPCKSCANIASAAIVVTPGTVLLLKLGHLQKL